MKEPESRQNPAAALSAAKQALLNRRLAGLTAETATPPLTVPRLNDRSRAPLSFAQERIWFLRQWEDAAAVYNRPVVLRLRGPLDVGSLRKAVGEVVRRHEALRTVFESREGALRSRPVPARDVDLPVTDLTDLPSARREDEARRLAEAETAIPIDLSRGPVLRACLLRLGARDHVLVLVIHHISFDGRSEVIFTRELSSLYEAFSRGDSPGLPEPPIQYADYASWQRRQVDAAEFQEDLAYWKEHLAPPLPVLNLPTDFPRPPTQTYRGAIVRFEIDPVLLSNLEQLSRQGEATLFMVLLTAYQVFLHRYAGQDDLLVGVPVEGRDHVEAEAAIGVFVNTLLLRADLSGAPTFRELLQRNRAQMLSAYRRQRLPFERLIQELQPLRDLSRPAFFQTLLILENYPHQAQPGSIEIERFLLEHVPAPVDLMFEVKPSGEGLACELVYNVDLFAGSTVARMAQHLTVLLKAAVANPDGSVAGMPLLTSEDTRSELVVWNDTKTEYPRDACVHELFQEQARRQPDALAVEANDGKLTYGELNRRANRLAHRLRDLGVGPGVSVTICLERSAAWIVGLLGVLKAGGAYVPLDPSYPIRRLAFMISDAASPILLTSASLLDRLPTTDARVLLLDRATEELRQEAEDDLPNRARGETLAYIIYTSGSTGRPKGVMIPHRGIVRLVRNTNYLEIGPGQRMAQVSNATFDAAMFEVWGALLNGACLVILPREILLQPRLLADEFRQKRIDVTHLITSLFNEVARVNPYAFRHMKSLYVGGETVDPKWMREVLKASPPERLYNAYGPAESTVFATTYRVETVPEDARSVPVGLPVSNSRVYILDAHLQPVPVGVPGEICIGGDGLATGYRNLPDRTAESFVPDPFTDETDGELYRTGDIGRRLPDGNIDHLGRKDHQVKVRGFRIEPGEIEALLESHPQIARAVVTSFGEDTGTKRLVAYLVPHGGKPGQDPLRDFVASRLPEYMIPSTFVFLEALPLSPNGKVDRQALPEPDADRPDLSTQFVAPRDDIETIIADIWSNLTGVDRVGVHDGFFALGGHSLLAVRLLSRITELFGVEIPIRKLFELPTVENLAKQLARCGPRSEEELRKQAEIILKVGRLSDEEAARLLDQKSH